jgi:hypothetical protein
MVVPTSQRSIPPGLGLHTADFTRPQGQPQPDNLSNVKSQNCIICESEPLEVANGGYIYLS